MVAELFYQQKLSLTTVFDIDELQAYGITKLYSPDDGRRMGLEGMINDVVEQCRESNNLERKIDPEKKSANGHTSYALDEWHDIKNIAHSITLAEANLKFTLLENPKKTAPVLAEPENHQ